MPVRPDYYRSWRYRYVKHRLHAKQHGTPFLLTFGEWCAIWRNSGRWHQCGHSAGQYVMARYGDQGAYEWGNVRICTVEENHAEWSANNHQFLVDRMLGERNPYLRWLATASKESIEAHHANGAAKRRGRTLAASTRAAMTIAHTKRWAAYTSEQRAEYGQKVSVGLKKIWTPQMSEDRSVNKKNWWATMTPEERSARLKQSWVTRKQKEMRLE